MKTDNTLDRNSKIDFVTALDNLVIGIKKDYADWMTSEDMIERFNKGINIRTGKKYTKVIQGSSVWGFIANGDGVLKGIPYKTGDVFKAAGWAAPAKWARGNIFDGGKFYQWTGPNYL